MKYWKLYILEILLAISLGWQIGRYIGSSRAKQLVVADPMAGYVVNSGAGLTETEINVPTVTVMPSNTPAPTKKKPSPTYKPVVRIVGDTGAWGVAKQIDEHTWTMKVGMDARMATPQEVLVALNDYRARRGSQKLTWDDKLAGYANERAVYLAGIKNTDGHKGFLDYVNNQNGFEKLGFDALGENISYGYQLEAIHLIEWMYAGDKPHDDNQVSNKWNYVGIGVKGTATCLIFGTGRH